jgi:ATP-binding cassette subfamily C (CFTR/MRP) protein 1
VISLRVNGIHIKQGQFIGVVGQVGSGKSTLLNAILNEVDKIKGTVRRRGSVAYIPQVSWLRSATIRENILFESPYDEERYKDILKRCELESDFLILPGVDLTEVGERGVNLSGGQKQRISIARALYADADIYLIDDCLSALDSYVAKKIYASVIREALALKTVVFVTHAIQYVHDCDEIIVMSNKEIYEKGNFQDLSSNPDSLYNTLEVQYKKRVEKDEEAAEAERKQKEEEMKKKQSSVVFEVPEEKEKIQQKIKALVKVEERTKGSVPWSVYYRFFTGAGQSLTIMTFVFITLGQLARVASDWWLGCWSSDSFHLQQQTYI